MIALCKFGHFSLVSKISQILLKLEHHVEYIGSADKEGGGSVVLGMSNVPLQIWAFCLVRKISQELLELEHNNLMNRLEVMRKRPS